MSFTCDPCVATFTSYRGLVYHEGGYLNNGRTLYDPSPNHQKRLEDLAEARKIWTKYHSRKGPMPLTISTKGELKDKPQDLPDNVTVVIPLGEEKSGLHGTIPCTNPICRAAIHPYLGGYKEYKTVGNVTYKINGLADCQTKYDGKFRGEQEQTDLANYVASNKIWTTRVLREFYQAKFKRETPSEKELTNFILYLRSIKSENAVDAFVWIYGRQPGKIIVKQEEVDELKKFKSKVNKIRPSDGYLHFMREDCHHSFMRIDVTAVCDTDAQVNATEKHAHEVSGSTHYWTGATNLINENVRTNDNEYRPPTAFCMLAPLETLTKLESWMNKHGIQKEYHYPRKTLISSLKPIAASHPSSSSTTSSSNSTFTSEQQIREKKINWLLLGPLCCTREQAEAQLNGLDIIDEDYYVKKRKLE